MVDVAVSCLNGNGSSSMNHMHVLVCTMIAPGI